MKRVLLLPCDTRPPTLELPHQLARVAGLEMRSPSLEILNQMNEPGNTAAIAEWLRREAPAADVAIVTLETLCLGGMIPARRVSDSLEETLQRLEVLHEIKHKNPSLRILAHGVVVRVAHDNDPLEEKPYYGEWGAGLRKVSEWMDRLERKTRPAYGGTRREEGADLLAPGGLERKTRPAYGGTRREEGADLLAPGGLERKTRPPHSRTYREEGADLLAPGGLERKTRPPHSRTYREEGADLLAPGGLERRIAVEQEVADAQMELDRARLHLPKEVLQDWLETRERNHALHMAAIDLLNEGILEHLCLTLDDTTPYGLAARDRRRLEARVDELGLWSEADIYPGADEVACTLLARALVNHSGRKTKILVRYPSVQAQEAELLYEDRPLGELVKSHIRAAGGVMVQTAEEADLVLAVNAPAIRQAHHQPDFETVDTAARHLPELIDRLVGDQATGRMVAVADVAYANGAENRLMQLLLQSVNLPGLASFAAWNTAGNSLGSAIAAGVCALYGDDPVSLAEANFSRLVDDWLYQSRVRWEVHDKLTEEIGKPPNPFDLGDLKWGAELAIDQRLTPLAYGLWQQFFAPSLPGVKLEWSRPRLAWPRLFTGVFPLRLVREEE